MSRSNALFVVKLLIGIGLIVLLVTQKGVWKGMIAAFQDVSAPWLTAVFLMPLVLIFASCVKWRLILRYMKRDIGVWHLCKVYIVSYFFSNFLPGSLGGDFARAYIVGQRVNSQVHSFAAVFLERLTGLITLAVLAAGAYVVTPALRSEPVVSLSILALTGGCILLTLLMWSPLGGPRVASRLQTIPYASRAFAKFAELRGSLAGFWVNRTLALKTIAYSLLFHALAVVNVYVAALALNVDVNFLVLCAVTPVVLVLASVPITPSGIGVMEWAYSLFLIPAGATLDEGLAIALLLRAQAFAASLAGGVIFLADSKNMQRRAKTAPSTREAAMPGGKDG